MTTELEVERDSLLRRLRELDDEHAAGGLDEIDYQNLRDDYTARAAEVLRRLDAAVAGPSQDGPSQDGPQVGVVGAASRPGRRGVRRRLVAGALVLGVVAGGAGYALASSKPRGATDEVSGSLPEGSVDRITRAQLLVSEGEILAAVRVYDDLLKDDPENPVALAQRGWLLSRVDPKLIDSGLAGIERSISLEPDYAEAHFFRGMILWRAKGDPAGAVESFQRAIDSRPPPEVLASIQEVKARAEADAAATAAP